MMYKDPANTRDQEEVQMPKGQEKPAKMNKPKLSVKERQAKKLEKKAAKA